MFLLARIFARYAAHVGYLDGKRNFPGEKDFIEINTYETADKTLSANEKSGEVLKMSDLNTLK